MPRTNFKELLDAGVHFGHLKRKWNPAMAPYIFMERNGIHIIDLEKTVVKIDEAASAMKHIARSGKKVLFVATKKQAKDIVIKAAMVNSSGSTTIASASTAIIGLNLAGSNLAGSVNTGDSYNGLVAPTATPSTGLPFRILSLVPDTASEVTATGSSTSTTITLTGTGLPSAIPQGADVAYLDASGQLIQTGSFVANSGGYAAGTTSIAINAAIAVPGSITAIPSSSTIVFTSYPEVLVKINFGIHNYYAA